MCIRDSVEAFLLSGDIYEDAKRHNVVFVGRDRNGTPRYAHVRGTADTFRQDIALSLIHIYRIISAYFDNSTIK